MSFLEDIVRFFFTQHQPWYVYALLGLIPLCILISIREFCCWFWKINKLVDKLERIELQMRNTRSATQPPPEVRPVPRRTGPDQLAGPPPKRGPTEL